MPLVMRSSSRSILECRAVHAITLSVTFSDDLSEEEKQVGRCPPWRRISQSSDTECVHTWVLMGVHFGNLIEAHQFY